MSHFDQQIYSLDVSYWEEVDQEILNNKESKESDENKENKIISKQQKTSYKKYTNDIRRQVLNEVFIKNKKNNFRKKLQNCTIREVSQRREISSKNIKRWMKNGPDRKVGGGRKAQDPEMEEGLGQWLRAQEEFGVTVTNREIVQKAKQLSNISTFKASKGWLIKFMHRWRKYEPKRQFKYDDESIYFNL